MNIFAELFAYMIFAAFFGGAVGSQITSWIVTSILTAAVIILPPTIFGFIDDSPAHPGKLGFMIAGALTIIGCVIGLWIGYAFF